MVGKCYDIEEWKNDSLIKLMITQFYDIKFSKKSFKEKAQMLMDLDEEISKRSGIKSAIIEFENKELNYDDNKIFLGNYDQTENGIRLLHKYLYGKRLQYQLVCINEKKCGEYTKEQFDYISLFYKKTPITGKNSFVFSKRNFQRYLFNGNIGDAYIFAAHQLSKCTCLMNQEYLIKDYSFFERLELLINVNVTLNTASKAIKKFFRDNKNKSIINKMSANILRYIQMESNERAVLTQIKNKIKQAPSKFDPMLISALDKNVWDCLNVNERKKFINYLNYTLSQTINLEPHKISYDKYELITYDEKDNKIHIGNVENLESIDMISALTYNYCKDKIVKYRQEQNNRDSKFFDKLMVDMQKCARIVEENGYGDKRLKNNVFLSTLTNLAEGVIKNYYKMSSSVLLLNGIEPFKNAKKKKK